MSNLIVLPSGWDPVVATPLDCTSRVVYVTPFVRSRDDTLLLDSYVFPGDETEDRSTL